MKITYLQMLLKWNLLQKIILSGETSNITYLYLLLKFRTAIIYYMKMSVFSQGTFFTT